MMMTITARYDGAESPGTPEETVACVHCQGLGDIVHAKGMKAGHP